MLNKLINENKVKGKGGMLCFPKHVIGNRDVFGNNEIGNRPKEIGEDAASELEDGVVDMEGLIASDPMRAVGELGYGYEALGDASVNQLAIEAGIVNKR